MLAFMGSTPCSMRRLTSSSSRLSTSRSTRTSGGFFFFQEEDCIRSYKVTGVQTCALPICLESCESVRELVRNQPDLVGVTLRDLRQHLQVLVGEQLRVDVAVVDRGEDGPDRFGLTLGADDLRLAIPFGSQNRALL